VYGQEYLRGVGETKYLTETEEMNTIVKVTCLVCNWSSQDADKIESANQYGECLGGCAGQEVLLRWDLQDDSIIVTNSQTGDRVSCNESVSA
jgi:hypothetical protein